MNNINNYIYKLNKYKTLSKNNSFDHHKQYIYNLKIKQYSDLISNYQLGGRRNFDKFTNYKADIDCMRERKCNNKECTINRECNECIKEKCKKMDCELKKEEGRQGIMNDIKYYSTCLTLSKFNGDTSKEMNFNSDCKKLELSERESKDNQILEKHLRDIQMLEKELLGKN